MDNENHAIDSVQPDELTSLKERADVMGISYHPNIGIKTLKAKIDDKMNPPKETDNLPYAEQANTIVAAEKAAKFTHNPGARKPTIQDLAAARKKAALRLVRIRVTNMNPVKGNLRGEILSVGNAELGMIKKFIPYNAEQGWHVPQILLTQLQSKKFMSHYEVKIGNKRVKRNKLVPEYAIEILPALTAKELEELKQRQIIANN